MDIVDLFTPDRVIPALPAPSKERVLQELCRRAATDLNLDPSLVLGAITAREALGSTGMGMGTAIPHARLASVKSPYGIVARLARSVDYESVDGLPVDLVWFSYFRRTRTKRI
jgi:PTS system nitrogen regulatory IIA component